MENKAAVFGGQARYGEIKKRNRKENLYRVLVVFLVLGIWQLIALRINSPLLLPTPISTGKALFESITDKDILVNLFITMQRVIKGFLVALGIGIPLGYIMGLSRVAEVMLGGIVDSIRQVPVMAWIPLTIIWLGIGDGPTIFMIAISGIFPVILNTIEGVQNISKDYYNAARSMGASRFSIFINIVVPASLPDVLIGARIAVGAGWMSVI